VKQRAVPGTGARRIDPDGHRLNGHALVRQARTGAANRQAHMPVRMPMCCRQMPHAARQWRDGPDCACRKR
jgi:hypothetical protein